MKHHVEDRSSEEGLVRGRGRGVDRVNGPYLRIDRRRPKDVAKAMIDSVTRWRDSSNTGRQPTKGAAWHACMHKGKDVTTESTLTRFSWQTPDRAFQPAVLYAGSSVAFANRDLTSRFGFPNSMSRMSLAVRAFVTGKGKAPPTASIFGERKPVGSETYCPGLMFTFALRQADPFVRGLPCLRGRGRHQFVWSLLLS